MDIYISGNALIKRIEEHKDFTAIPNGSAIAEGYAMAHDHIIRIIEQEMLFAKNIRAWSRMHEALLDEENADETL